MISVTILLFICLVPILLVASATIWWLFIRERQHRWLILALLCWLGAHGVFLIPFQGLAYAFVVLYGLVLGVPVALFCALTFFDRRNDYFRIVTLLVWLLTPLTLPGVMVLRDLPISEQRGRCYIERVGVLLETYYQQNGQYPDVIGEDTFGNAPPDTAPLRLLNAARIECFRIVGFPWYRPNVVDTTLLYQRQGEGYVLGGYYGHFVLNLVGLTRVCHYDQATKDVSCGFNNWAPFSPP